MTPSGSTDKAASQFSAMILVSGADQVVTVCWSKLVFA